jgi:hypothetical protein
MVNFSQLGRPMANLKLASTKIPIGLVDRLNRYTESTGVNQSAAIRRAIELFLDSVESTKSTELTDIEGSSRPSQLVARVNAVDDRLTAFEARLTAIESRSVSTAPSAPPKPKNKPKSKPNTTPSQIVAVDNDRLTVKEAFKELGNRGYSLGRESLRRALEPAIDSGIMPDELSALGLSADFELRRSVSRFASNTRWLYFN